MPISRSAPTRTVNPRNEHGHSAVMLVGHGSLRRGSGASMIRLAARLRRAGVAPIAQAAFLNYSRPSVADGIARCIARGAREITVVPYFLVSGWFVRQTLPQLLQTCRAQYPGITICQTEPLGDHPALARLVMQRALEADYLQAFPQLFDKTVNRLCVSNDSWRPFHTQHRTGLLMVAHGSPDADNNRPIYAVAERVRASGRYASVTVCFMDLNQPSISEAVDDCVQHSVNHIIAVPYFLQMGNHVADDLPRLIGEARVCHPQATVVLSEHLGYDRLLLAPIVDRIGTTYSLLSPPELRPTASP